MSWQTEVSIVGTLGIFMVEYIGVHIGDTLASDWKTEVPLAYCWRYRLPSLLSGLVHITRWLQQRWDVALSSKVDSRRSAFPHLLGMLSWVATLRLALEDISLNHGFYYETDRSETSAPRQATAIVTLVFDLIWVWSVQFLYGEVMVFLFCGSCLCGTCFLLVWPSRAPSHSGPISIRVQ